MKRYFLIGYMGSGKTTLGHSISEELGLSFVDVDSYIEQQYHKTITELFESLGESGFREIERKMLHEVSKVEDVIISTGGGAPCFSNNMEYMKGEGIVIYLKVSPQRLFERLKKVKYTRPLLQNKTDEELSDYISVTLERRNLFYNQADIIFHAEDLATDEEIKRTTSLLAKELSDYK